MFLYANRYLRYTLFALAILLSGSLKAYPELYATVTVQQRDVDSVLLLKEQAFQAAKEGRVGEVVATIDSYVKKTLDLEFVEHSTFAPLREDIEFQQLERTYLPKIQWGSVIYIYAGLIGFFIVIMFNVQKEKDRIATILLSVLIFIHSFFIIHVGLHSMNYNLYVPHLYSTSTIFSFLYGPLMYFYFKRIKIGYRFKKIDLLHLLPTVVLIAFFLPIFILPEDEKLRIMLGVGKYKDRAYGLEISIGKMLSLLIYTYFTVMLFFKTKKEVNAPEYAPVYRWQRNIVLFQVGFTFTYAIYLVLLISYILTGPMFHAQLIILSALVLYVAYIAYVNPKTLLGYQLEASFLKYKNSGLTTSYSEELKSDMLRLLEEEKIYRNNTINLNTMAERLGTTRHNTSQIINEHFGLSFFELINQFRIKEAMAILEADVHGKKNIIDVAYEVGYNNKVTFNKSFKKINDITPSQYVKSLDRSKKE